MASSANGSLTYYRSVMVYEKPSGGAEQLSYVLHPEGIAAKSGTNSYRYRYFKTDHLGNTRRVLEASGTTLTAVQTTDFYPFGLAHELNNTQFNRYLYGGKELQTGTVGGNLLGMYDFHARFYNPVHGRWFNVDPALQFTSPYVYAGNSPMMYRDKDGEWVWLVVAIVAGGYLGGVQQSGSWNPGNWDWSSGQLWAGIGIGAVAGLAGYGAGQAVMGTFAAAGTAGATVVQGGAISGMAAGAAGGATTGLVNGSGQAWVGGASFWEGLGQGAEQSVWGAVTGGAAGGVISGSVSAVNGNNFWTGVAIDPPTPVVPASPAQTQPQPNNNAAANNNASNPPSERVQKVLDQMHEIQNEGGTVKMNPIDANQEVNMTIEHSTGKINMRVESHKLPAKYGVETGVPIRHMNVDVYNPYPTTLPVPEPAIPYQPYQDPIRNHVILK